MNKPTYILALDQGTTSSRSVLFDSEGQIVSFAQQEFSQHFPQPGWVEHDAEEIFSSQLATAKAALQKAGIALSSLAGIGITNQRETTVVWDTESGKAIFRAIVWQDRRTASLCEQLKAEGHEALFRERTGLLPDAYFSATKIAWILDHVEGARAKAEAGKLRFGTIDSWLMWKLSDGAIHATDVSNASRTMLFNLRTMQWDAELCTILRIPLSMLPEVRDSSGNFGKANLLGDVPIRGVAGDQQAALFGQCCFDSGMAKNTYGTGCFMLMNTGTEAVRSHSNLLSTVAWRIGGKTEYALEGSVFIAGAVIQWLRDGLGIIGSSAETEALARSVPDTGGLVFVPAFTGLGAPWWDMYARGMMIGITRGTTKAHLVRAALEAIAFQTQDVLKAMEKDSGIHLNELRVDGGATANDFLMQFQADVLGVPVAVPQSAESTAWGAASLAGLDAGLWDRQALSAMYTVKARFRPKTDLSQMDLKYGRWLRAVERAKAWEDPASY